MSGQLFTEDLPDLVLGVEVCEDMWIPVPPSALAALAGATVLANLSGSPITIQATVVETADMAIGSLQLCTLLSVHSSFNLFQLTFTSEEFLPLFVDLALNLDLDFSKLFFFSAELLFERSKIPLSTGDAVQFAGAEPHTWRNPSSRRGAVLLFVNCPSDL